MFSCCSSVKIFLLNLIGCFIDKKKFKTYNLFVKGSNRLEKEFDLVRIIQKLRTLDSKKNLSILKSDDESDSLDSCSSAEEGIVELSQDKEVVEFSGKKEILESPETKVALKSKPLRNNQTFDTIASLNHSHLDF